MAEKSTTQSCSNYWLQSDDAIHNYHLPGQDCH
jgi:hypothetical protein